MQYKVTTIVNSDYCQVQPSDNECQRVCIIDADSKGAAIMKIHEQEGMVRLLGLKCNEGKILPEIWSVEEV
jgi:hypothetical protein